MFSQTYSIIIAGVGGQGSLMASNILGNTALELGFQIKVSETFGESQRGGSVITGIRIGKKVFSPIIPLHTADFIIGLEPLEAYRNAIKYLKPGGNVILNTRPMYQGSIKDETGYPPIGTMIDTMKKIGDKVIAINATDMAIEAGGSIMVNMVMLGAASYLLPFEVDDLKKMIKNIAKNVDSNLKAFDLGLKYVEKIAG